MDRVWHGDEPSTRGSRHSSTIGSIPNDLSESTSGDSAAGTSVWQSGDGASIHAESKSSKVAITTTESGAMASFGPSRRRRVWNDAIQRSARPVLLPVLHVSPNH